MEPTIVFYIGSMVVLGLYASNILSKNCYNNHKKINIIKKKFKYYHSH